MTPQRQTSGTLATLCDRVRFALDEPSLRAKYTDAVLVDRLNEIWPEIVVDLYGAAQNPPLSRFDVTVDSNQEFGLLPATCGEVWYIEELDGPNGNVIGQVVPRSRYNAYGRGIVWEGGYRFKLDPKPTEQKYYRFYYVPSGEAVLLSAQVPTTSFTSTTVTLGTTTGTTLGSIDNRTNAYIGSLVSLVGYGGPPPTGWIRFPAHQRICTAHASATGTLTVDPAWEFDPSGLPGTTPASTVSVEIYPPEAQGLFSVLWRAAARDICADELRMDRSKMLNQRYQEIRRTTLLAWNRKQTIAPANYNAGIDWNNPDFREFV